MFGKGTFKSSSSKTFRPIASVADNRVLLESKISTFNEAENSTEDAVKAVQLYNKFLNEADNTDEEVQKLKEISILKAAQLIKNSGDFMALASFMRSLNGLWTVFPRAKTAKIVKSVLELFEEIGSESALLIEIELCKELLEWCGIEKRAFLKQSLETRLIALYHRTGQYTEALSLVSDLLRRLKRLDDKAALIEVHLLESKIYFALKNIAKARAALTSARTFANSMYTAPIIQASLDMQAGLLHAEEFDFKTSFSYFIEALDNYVNSQQDPRGIQSLKYLLLCKIMIGQPEEVEVILNGKLGQYYPMNRNFEAILAVSKSCIEKSLKSFETVLQSYPQELGEDAIVQSHLASLYDNLLEKNLLHLLLPYSRVQISYISSKIGLSSNDIEIKLSQMILDKILYAVIDNNSGCLLIQSASNEGTSTTLATKTLATDCDTFGLIQASFKNVDSIIESLIIKSKTI